MTNPLSVPRLSLDVTLHLALRVPCGDSMRTTSTTAGSRVSWAGYTTPTAGIGPADLQWRLEMTKLNITSYKDLVAAKAAIINYHNGDENEYLRTRMAADACFTSHNSMTWKQGQMADVKAELHSWRTENAGSEVVDTKIANKVKLYRSMEQELAELEDRHKADCEVHKTITGEAWKPRPKRTHKSDGLGELQELDALLAS